ncbi:hypothetical protein LTR10_022399 [Elasticomyces elasticus]|uniref:Vps72/YL1 C-terminal domain-containing protein n=1 Tax=Exophiala sideris TaxID=1016849 RepID=A0ABR0IZ31_9EURO|nr:hypothetical protein LTR10_022399 [Elasticomyces elasticus]KAK5022622.1 hypothetical protein LTS07_009845 [Exophiala sideris]KAK5027714.1 hypothetical protein LTR13_009421 [Exophiala sideris]KAK5052198.1 hypothetical protein LTR69_009960 [Exophiala sideris]KAK5178005.1 hypothetical protein LTR44_009554 [Eurotiomycetes sp. CCFEE 6388]
MTDTEDVDETPQLSDSATSDDDSEEERVETLISGREKRKTAGNRYDRELIAEEVAAEDDPDEVALLFAGDEEAEDEEFKSSDGEDDAGMSSSDDDDQGPNAAIDDMEGEKEIDKQAKAERAKKRKADLALTSVSGVRKKLKTDPTKPAPVVALAKPSKKKDRVTWVHDPDSGRGSLRKQTIAHRAETIARLKESEAQSKKLKAIREQRERERAKDAPKELTQADRLAEAARIERQNAKSLNRWETLERKRQEEQAAKLAALKNRKLQGPYVSWWSAKATWIGPKLSKIGTRDAGNVIEGGTEGKKRGRKSKAEQQATSKDMESGEPSTVAEVQTPGATASAPSATEANKPPPKHLRTEGKDAGTVSSKPESTILVPAEANTDSTGPLPHFTPVEPPTDAPKTTLDTVTDTPRDGEASTEPIAESQKQPPLSSTPSEPEDSFLKGIHEYASMPADNASDSDPVAASLQVNDRQDKVQQKSEVQQVSGTVQPEPKKVQSESLEKDTLQQIRDSQPTSVSQPASELSATTSNPGTQTEPNASDQATIISATIVQAESTSQKPDAAIKSTPIKSEKQETEQVGVPDVVKTGPEPEPVVENSTRSLVLLEKFDELSNESRQDYSLFYNHRKSSKPVKHSQELCPITTLPVRYRDPSTGIGYANVLGYKKLQELKQHKFVWSSMLGCYIGRDGGVVARGVPEGFVEK